MNPSHVTSHGPMHFGVECPECREVVAFPLKTVELVDAARRDPVEALRALPPDDRRVAVEFYAEHHAMGHTPEPTIFDVSPLPQA